MQTEKQKAVNDEVIYSLELFLEVVDVPRLNRGLRHILMAYLKHEMESGTHTFFDEMVNDLWFLFFLLDDIEKDGQSDKTDMEREMT